MCGARSQPPGILCALGWVSAAPASTDVERGIDPNQGESLVEVTLSSKGAAMRLQLEAETYGVEFNDHYLRRNGDGTVTATVFGNEQDLDALAAAGFDIGATIEGPRTWREHVEQRKDAIREERRADNAAKGNTDPPFSALEEVVILRADYFENRDGRFLSGGESQARQGGGRNRLDIRRADAVAVLEHRRRGRRSLPRRASCLPISTRTRRRTPTSSIASSSASARRAPPRRPRRRASAWAQAPAPSRRDRCSGGSAAGCRRIPRATRAASR